MRVEADGADVGRGGANDDMTAVAALPDLNAGFFEDFLRLDVFQKRAVTFFVVLFDSGDATELFSEFGKAFLFSLARHTGIHVSPLEIFTFGGVHEIFSGIAEFAERLEPKFRWRRF